MQWIILALSAIGAAFGCYFAIRCAQDARGVERHVQRLALMRASVIDLERGQAALASSLRRINGKLAHLATAEDVTELPPPVPRQAAPVIGTGGDRPPWVCENWAIACREGPRSEAARCECAYCLSMRMERARVRESLLPRGAEAHARHVEETKARA